MCCGQQPHVRVGFVGSKDPRLTRLRADLARISSLVGVGCSGLSQPGPKGLETLADLSGSDAQLCFGSALFGQGIEEEVPARR
jgi:hypothetical protein